jgi:DNA polymerase-3 subunit epsilon
VTEVKSTCDVFGVPLAELDFAVVDVETTGWSPDKAGITEIGAVRLHRGQVVAEFTSLVNPGTPVPPSIEELTGISDQMLALAPPVTAVMPGLLAFAEGCVLTAHNAPFDLGFLTAACAAAGMTWPGYPVLDTVRLARQLMITPDEVPDRKLRTLAVFFGATALPTHRALADARATAVVLGQLLRRLADRGVSTLGELTPWLEALEAAQAAAPPAATLPPFPARLWSRLRLPSSLLPFSLRWRRRETDKVWRGSVPRSSGGSEWSPPSS